MADSHEHHAPDRQNQWQTDLALAKRIARGDSVAAHELVDRMSGPMYAAAAAMLGNQHDAEDAVQETLMAVFSQIGRFRGQSTLRTWMTGILVRQVAAARRRARVRRTAPLPDRMPDGRPEKELDRDVQLDLPTLLEILPAEQRDVIVLREIEQLSYQEIAETLNIPRGTVESRIHRARQALREQFGEYMQD